jgi:hypothetical protein
MKQMKSNWTLVCVVVLSLAAQLSVFAAPPANDAFDAATVISGFPVTVVGSNIEATLETGEPLPSVGDPAASVWFRWTAPSNASVQINTFGSDFDTILAVWSGNSVSNLTLLAENDDYHGDTNSVVFMEVASGETYHIAVYGFDDAQGSIALNITNDLTSRISGSVTTQNGTIPIQGIEAVASQWNGEAWVAANVDSAYSEINGYYEIRGLTAGTYRVEFNDQTGNFIYQVYSNAVDLDSGTDIVVGVAATVADINASLSGASKITGTLTGPDGSTPAEGIFAQAYAWNGSGWSFLGGAYTDADGFYEIGGLAGGVYRVLFEDLSGGYYVSLVYSNAVDLDSGTDITVGIASTIANIDGSLVVADYAANIVGLAKTGADSWVISYMGTVGTSYIVQENASLTGLWQNVGSSFECAPGTNAVPLTSPASRAFWRIIKFP